MTYKYIKGKEAEMPNRRKPDKSSRDIWKITTK
jgi:hypothetical protein